MAERQWRDIAGRQLRVRDATWELTGAATLRDGGEMIGLAARRVDHARDRRGTLVFGAEGSDSLNPGADADRDQQLIWEDDDPVLVVETDGRSYRYRLDRVDAG